MAVALQSKVAPELAIRVPASAADVGSIVVLEPARRVDLVVRLESRHQKHDPVGLCVLGKSGLRRAQRGGRWCEWLAAGAAAVQQDMETARIRICSRRRRAGCGDVEQSGLGPGWCRRGVGRRRLDVRRLRERVEARRRQGRRRQLPRQGGMVGVGSAGAGAVAAIDVLQAGPAAVVVVAR